MFSQTGNVAHYSRLENLANILHDKRIRLGPIANLADPRECSLDWIVTAGLGHELNYTEWQIAEKVKNSVGKYLRIFCAAGVNDEIPEGGCPIESSIYGRPRMWSQYGGNSNGFCIVLNIDYLSQAMESLVTKKDHLISDEVTYYPWIHMVSGGTTIEYGDTINLLEKDVFELINNNSMLRSIYFKKSIDWRDEQEFRWLLFAEHNEIIYVDIEKAIEAVILGWRFPPNQVSQAKDYCRSLGCPCSMIDYEHPRYKLHNILT